MPFTGKVRLDKRKQHYPHNGYLSTFSHENEAVQPGYYTVSMGNGVKVELAATERVGFHSYYFPEDKQSHIIIDLKKGINDRTTKSSITQHDEH